MILGKKIKAKDEDKRKDVYLFQSKKDLISFFSNWIPKDIILETMRIMREKFIKRKGCSRKETKLQYLKKCEFALVRSQNLPLYSLLSS